MRKVALWIKKGECMKRELDYGKGRSMMRRKSYYEKCYEEGDALWTKEFHYSKETI